MSKKKNLVKHLKRTLSKDIKISEKEKGVLRTLWYKQIFDCPIGMYEISHYLMGNRIDSLEELKYLLTELFRKDLIEFNNGKYHFKNAKDTNWVSRKNDSKELVGKGMEIAKVVSKIPWITMIGLTGSVSALNAGKNDDIDFFIVTEKNRAWITRLFLVLLLKFMNVYRTDKNYAGKICPNIIIDETQLEWPKAKQNLYTANEILMLRPIYYRNNQYFRFLNYNAWVNKFFPNFFWDTYVGQTTPNKKLELPHSKIIDGVEFMLRTAQRVYMKRKKTTEITKPNLIHFNKVDWTKKILDELEEVENLLKLNRPRSS